VEGAGVKEGGVLFYGTRRGLWSVEDAIENSSTHTSEVAMAHINASEKVGEKEP
jgi:hypothetical protein